MIALRIDNYDSRELRHTPPHEAYWARMRMATISVGPIRLGASYSTLIGAQAYIRVGHTKIATTIGKRSNF